MARTDVTKVQQVIDTALESTQINMFIADCSLWVTEELSDAGLSDSRLELIERYLVCAMIRIRDLGLSSSTMGDTTENYQVDATVTDYLKRAASFDPTGKVGQVFLQTAIPGMGPSKPMKFGTGSGYSTEEPVGRWLWR